MSTILVDLSGLGLGFNFALLLWPSRRLMIGVRITEMEFDLHTTARFSDEFTREDYEIAQMKYLHHLAKIDFRNVKSLLKYFGNSFFHDAEVSSLELIPSKQQLILSLFSINDLEDINNFRKEHDLSEVSFREYRKEPINYDCRFQGVSQFSGRIELERGKTIIDSELHNGIHQNSFRVLISFSDTEEIEFYCRACVVNVDNKEKILKYTGGRRKSIPYCSTCRSRMLSKQSIEKLIKS